MVPPRDDHAPDCPSPDQLQRIAQGFALPDEESSLIQHLDICEACRGRFEALLATTEEQDALGRIRLEDEEADLSAILAAGVPSRTPGEDVERMNPLPGGLHLDPPREPRFLGSMGDFDVLLILGEGGMGVVLRAVDRSLGREVALKLMNQPMAKDPIARQRFIQEARAVARLNHPNIVTVHSVAEFRETPYFVMEYVAGASLAQILAVEKRLEPERAVRIACQILVALDHAHQAGIVHRDVKPANILFEGAHRVKLADFGVARGVADATHLTVVGSTVGTPWYMAPEQAVGNAATDPRQDLFSVGIVLFEMLTGTLPFPGPSPVHVLTQIRHNDPPDPIRYNPQIPRELADVVLHALRRDPALRFQSAAEFAKALEAMLPRAGHASPAVSQGNELLQKCSSCGSTIIKSQTSLGGRCEICHDPLCAKCWTIQGVRRCPRHLQPEPVRVERSAAPDVAAEVAHAAAPAPPPLSQARPIPAAMAMSEKPPSVEPSREEASAEAKAAPDQVPESSSDIFSIRKRVREEDERSGAQGRTVVKTGDVEVRVETFLRRVANALQTLEDVKDPLRGVVIPVPSWSKAARRVSGPEGIVTKLRAASPQSPRHSVLDSLHVVYELGARSWLGRSTGRIIIEARSLVRSERFAADGCDDRPIERIVVETALNGAALRAAREETWHLVILGSPTGWTSDACRFVTRTDPDSFHDQNVSAVLSDSEAGRFLSPHNDEKLSSFRTAFEANDDSTMLDWARLFLRDYLGDNSSITHETLAQKLGINRATGIRAMKLLAESGNYNLEFVDGVGWVMTR
jgi:serine/threonine protein kinase